MKLEARGTNLPWKGGSVWIDAGDVGGGTGPFRPGIS